MTLTTVGIGPPYLMTGPTDAMCWSRRLVMRILWRIGMALCAVSLQHIAVDETATSDLVPHIIRRRSEIQMVRIHTMWHITVMQHLQAIWYRTIREFPSEAVGSHILPRPCRSVVRSNCSASMNMELPIADTILKETPGPQPACCGLLHMFPKSFRLIARLDVITRHAITWRTFAYTARG